jgi:hypothetical protein
MEGRVPDRQFSREIHREFASSRLEEQILIRVFDLVMPAIGRHRAEEEQSSAAVVAVQVHSPLAKGA